MDAPRVARPTRLLLCLALSLPLLAGPAAALARDIQDDILAQTAAIRGLAPKAPVPLAVVDSAQVRKDLLASVEGEQATRELEISRKLLVLLGLLSPDADLQGMLVDLYAENIVGYYNHNDKKMYVVSGRSIFGPEEKITLAHEYTHALQDQYFDLGQLQAGVGDNGDRATALTSLIEGDATFTMIQYARKYLSPDELVQLQASASESSLDRAPLVIRDEVLFPYQQGLLFVASLGRDGGYEAVNRAFGDPPHSTEQIIHPEKYLTHEEPIEVSLPDLAAALGPGWTLLRSDVLGELDVRILLEQFGDPVTAAKGSEGWGGDRYAFLENAAGQDALLISTAWDSEGDAGEFFDLYADTVRRRYGARASRTADSPARIAWATPNGALLLQRWGPRVGVAIASDDRTANSLIAAISPAPPAQPTPSPTPTGPVPAPVQVPR